MKKWLIRCLTVLAMVCLIPGIVLKAAAETTTVRCKNCGSTETREILGYRKYDSNSHRVYVTECQNCHNDGNVSYLKVHTGGTQGPTCTEGKICEKCGAEYGVLGHDWGAWTPNYASNGTHTRRCKRCNAEETGSCSGGYATCDTLGMCNTCGGSYYGGHAWGEWSSAGNGTHTRRCTNYCREVENESCSGGTGTFTCTKGKTCEKCGAEYGVLGHDWDAWTSNGDGTHTRRCKRSNCDAVENESCSGGTGTFTCITGKICEKCGAEYGILGHDWGKWKPIRNMNMHLKICNRCNRHETAYCTGGTATCSAEAVCVECGGAYGEKDSNNHDLVQHAAKAATCTEIGWDAYKTCSRCDYTTYAEQPALNHALVNHDAKAPTCTEIGWNAYDTCSRCDYTTYAELPALNHDYQAVTVEPTCETDGYTVFTCSRCKDSYTADPTDKLGHQFGAWSPNGTGAQSAGCLRQGCVHTGSTDCRKFTFRTAEGETLTFCPVCGQAENAAQLEKIEAATAWANSGSLSAEDVTARTNGEYLSVAFETAGSLTQPTGLVRLALPAGLLEGKKLVRIAPDGTQTEMPFETERGTIILTLDFANSELPVMLFRLVPQTAAL